MTAGTAQLERVLADREALRVDDVLVGPRVEGDGLDLEPRPVPTLDPRSRRRRRRRIALAVSAVFAVPIAALVALTLVLVNSFSGLTVLPESSVFPDESTRPAASTSGAVNILLLGTDSRAGLGDEDDIEDGGETGQRADTMVVAHIPADGSGVTLMSLMRDLWVPIPGHGEAKLNAAFSLGGLPLAIETIEGVLGARMDHVAVVDFEGFASIADALGGVAVTSPKAFETTNMPGYSFVEGRNVVSGDEALAFVRERYAFPDSDYQRVENQRSFLEGVFSGMVDSAGRLDVARVTSTLSALSENLIVDQAFDAQTVVGLATRVSQSGEDGVSSLTLPTRGGSTSADGQSIVLLDAQAAAGIGAAMASDDLASYLADHGLTKDER